MKKTYLQPVSEVSKMEIENAICSFSWRPGDLEGGGGGDGEGIG